VLCNRSDDGAEDSMNHIRALLSKYA